MGDAPKRGDGSDLSGAGDAALADVTKQAEPNERAKKATVQGMVPLQRAPARVGSDTPDE
jgi:hypothetical protein